MPHFSSSSAGGSPSELIRLWRSRLSTTSDIGKATGGSGDRQNQKRHLRQPTAPPPLEPGVLSQQSKMSEAQDVSSVVDSRESSVTEITRQKSEIDEEREDSEDASETPKSECASTPRSDEPEKSFVPDSPSGQASAPTQPQQQQPPPPPQQQQQLQQNRPGECNLLPVLVERLRSALELSCSSQSSEDQLPLEDSGVDSEEDFRLWSTGLSGVSSTAATSDQEAPIKPKLDLKFLEDILLADIHTALARLQDTLKRVDIGTLTRYNASLDPSNKLYLLRLISNLLAKLKVPEEAIAKSSPAESRAALRRRRNERHTISVSAEEIARARRWLDEKTPSSDESSPKADLDQESHPERIVEAAAQVAKENPGLEASMTFSDKCRKDAINQQQSLQNRNGYAAQKENGRTYEQALDRALTAPKRFDGLCKDDSVVDDFQERSTAFYQQHSTAPTRHNKFTAKKTKIKRANTIDIPNYLKLRNEHEDQNGCFALRRPIGVGDRFINGHQKVVPSFEPKTDNDRKFLALINKNTESANGSPFRSFNYRQTSSVADKNWSNRFSNIKTNFDKPQPNEGEGQRKPGKLDARKKFENARDDSLEREGMVVGSFKVPYPAPAKQNQNGFTHAPTSPFQKIEKSSPKPESAPPFLKAGYMPKSGSMLQAKLKMFDQEPSKPVVPNNAEQSRVKNKFVKPLENNFAAAKQQPTGKHAQERRAPTSPTLAENGHLNYYSFCKQFAPFASGKSTEGKSNINTAKSKLLENINKETDKPVIKRNNPKVPFQDRKNSIPKPEIEDNRHDFAKQYSYHKPYDGYLVNSYQDSVNHQNAQNYRHVEKKPEFNDRRASYQEPQRKFEAPTQNVAVQTTIESANRRPSEPELINSIAELSRDYPVPQPRKLKNNASVQTTSPSVISPIQQSYTNTLTPNVNSSVPHTYQNYNPPMVTSAPGHAVYQPSADPVARSYYNANYASDQNYQPPINNYSHPSVPYHQSAGERKPSLKDIPALNHPVPAPRPAITQKLYNEFSKLPDQSPNRPIDYNKNESTLFPPITISYKDVHAEDDKFQPQAYLYEDKPLPDLIEENIQNQEISSDGVVTRYTCAIATVSPNPESPEPTPEFQSPPLPPQPYEPVVPRIKESQPRHFAETTSISTSAKSAAEMDEIQRHNMLQQSLIRRMQNEQQQQQPQYHQPEKIPPRRFSQEIRPKENRSPTSPPFSSANFPGRVCALKALNESHKAQEKINMFEEKKLNNQQLFRPLNVPPKMSIVNPSSVLRNERSPIRNNASPIDSSDEYLMSCANKPNRNIVLSKSESWHQLALAKGAGGLQLPQPSSGAELKPPKPKSPSSLRLSKQFEASSASDNMRKMEEKIQRYFCSPSSSNHSEESSKQTTTTTTTMSSSSSSSNRRESKSKRNLQSKKNNLNNLMRSHTMPHLYDDRLFDDSVDVDKAFDSIFNEATRSDLRH